MKFNPFRFIVRKKSASVRFWVNNVVADWWSSSLDSSDTTHQGIINTAEGLPDIWMVTDHISRIVSNIPVTITNAKGEQVNNKDLQRILKQPNYYQNWNEIIKQAWGYYELLGNTYLYIPETIGFRIPSSLYVLPAQYVSVLITDKTKPNWLNEVLGYQVSYAGEFYTLPMERVLHKRDNTYRTDDGAFIYGISKYIPANKIAGELTAIYDAKKSIIGNRGAMGILSNESEIPDPDESALIKTALKDNFGVGTEQDKFIVTTQKLSWQQMSMNVAELQIIENAKYSFEKICQINGFDPVIFSTDGSTFANKHEATKAFIKNVIKPKVDDFYNDLNEFLAPYFGDFYIMPDWSRVEELRRDVKALTDIYTKQVENMILTPYEAYKLIYDKEPENVDIPREYFRRSGLVPVMQPEPEEPEIDPDLLEQIRNGNGND